MRPQQIAVGSVQMVDPDDLEVQELSSDPTEFHIDEDSPAEQELEAFIEGAKRPQHLDDRASIYANARSRSATAESVIWDVTVVKGRPCSGHCTSHRP